MSSFKVTRIRSDAVLLEGGFQPGDDAVLRSAITPDTRTLVLNLSGGDVRPGIAMGKMIHDRRLHVVVDGLCASSCANYLFAAGHTKEVTQDSVVLWHGGVTDRIVDEMPGLVRKELMKLKAPEAAIQHASNEAVKEWKQVQQEQRDLYRLLRLPVVLLEGLESFPDLQAFPGTESATDSMVFIAYPALSCAGLKGLQRSWTPPQSWWPKFFQAARRKRSIVRSRKLETSLCRSGQPG